MTRTYPKFFEDFRRRPKMSEDVPNNSEVLNKMIQCFAFKSSVIPYISAIFYDTTKFQCSHKVGS